jgi:hypothetical protein
MPFGEPLLEWVRPDGVTEAEWLGSEENRIRANEIMRHRSSMCALARALDAAEERGRLRGIKEGAYALRA